jgi:hypothetical protein
MFEVVDHPRNHLLVLTESVGHELGIEAMLDHAAFVLGPPLERRLIDLGEPLLAWHLQESRPERRGKGHDRTRVVHVFVDQLVVEPDAVTSDRRFRHQRRVGKRVIDVIEDQ